MKGNRTLQESRWTWHTAGFTLVELLVVIVIIGILAGLISTAVIAAMGRAREARVILEIQAMSNGLQLFKDRYGDFPPSNLQDANKVRAFLRRAFPRYASSGDPYSQFVSDLAANDISLTVSKMDAAAALAFWLGGMPDSTGKPCGFAKDPENPFRKPSAETMRYPPLHEFTLKRFVVANNTMRYYPDISGAIEADAPYVYFRAVEYASVSFRHNAGGEDVTITPYQNPSTGEYFNPQTFQIISAGRDNLYGGPYYEDNLTNFTEGKLKNALK
jgi:prepilin-type N-terminal cleavage/methylation domain-containing protein